MHAYPNACALDFTLSSRMSLRQATAFCIIRRLVRMAMYIIASGRISPFSPQREKPASSIVPCLLSNRHILSSQTIKVCKKYAEHYILVSDESFQVGKIMYSTLQRSASNRRYAERMPLPQWQGAEYCQEKRKKALYCLPRLPVLCRRNRGEVLSLSTNTS